MIGGNCNINILQPQHMNAKVNGKKELRNRRISPLDEIKEVNKYSA